MSKYGVVVLMLRDKLIQIVSGKYGSCIDVSEPSNASIPPLQYKQGRYPISVSARKNDSIYTAKAGKLW